MITQSDISRSTLSNGLKIISKNIPSVETISISLWVPVGARYETSQESGLSHMLEHMFFKGTPTRTAQQIAEEIESFGAHFNAYTSREATVFTIRALAEDLEDLLIILGDIIKNSTFDPKELSKERDVVLQEIAMTNDNPDDLIFDLIQEASFANQAMGRPILGSVENVSGFSQHDLQNFKKKYYDPSCMILCTTGKVDPDHFAKIAQEQFDDFPKATSIVPDQARYTGGIKQVKRDLEQVHSILGFEGVPMGSDNYYETALLGTILGGGMSSRLFQEVRENLGLVYSIFAYHSSFVDTGFFGIYASMTPENYEKVLQTTKNELDRFPETLTEKELKRAKQQLKSSLMMGLESVVGQCDQLVHHIRTYDRPLSTEEILEKVNGVTCQNIAERASKIFTSPQTLVSLGPL